MPSIRQEKVSRLLQRELGTYFQRESSLFGGAMITVTVVRMSPDMGIAKVYISIFAAPDKNKVLEKVEHLKGEIKRKLGQDLRHNLRMIPDLHFYIDDSLDYAENIENLLNK